MLEVRKVLCVVEETRSSAGRAASTPLRKAAAMAVVRNPLAGRGFVEDITGLVEPSEALGRDLGERARELLGAPVESYGKGAICGIAGEQEHANACLTSAFGNAFRKAIGGGEAWISSVTKVGGPGTAIDVPLAYKDELWVRSHYDAIELRVPDAPMPDEIVVIAVVADRGRLHARLGGMTVEEAVAKVAGR